MGGQQSDIAEHYVELTPLKSTAADVKCPVKSTAAARSDRAIVGASAQIERMAKTLPIVNTRCDGVAAAAK